MSNLLTGNTRGTAYTGTAANQPANWSFEQRPPNQYDIKYSVGDLWLDQSATPEPEAWVLVSLAGDSQSRGELAHWIRFSGNFGNVDSLTGDTGGAVPPDGDGNINVITDNAGNNAGSSVIIVGTPANNTLTLNVTDADSNTLIGKNSGTLTISGSGNTALGAGDLSNISSGDSNTAVGLNALQLITTGSNNTALGVTAGGSLATSDSNNVFINYAGIAGSNDRFAFSCPGGTGLFLHNYSSSSANGINSCLFLGPNSGNPTETTPISCVGIGNAVMGNITGIAAHNVGVGCNALQEVTTGRANTAVGHAALQSITTGVDNVAVGYTAATGIQTGDANVAVGNGALLNATTTAFENTAIGDDALGSITTGNTNTALGNNAGQSLTGTDSDNIMIRHDGVAGDNNIIRIGTTGNGSGQQNKCFIAAIRGVTTDVNDAIAVLIDSAGQLGTVSSSIRYKENIKDMGHESDVIMQLRPVIFNYKKDEKKAKHYGLIAEEVAEVFSRLVVYDKEGNAETVKYHELPIMLLNELKKQQKTINALSMSVRHLENVLQAKKDCSCN